MPDTAITDTWAIKDSTNFNTLSAMLLNFGDLAILGTAFLTQLLAWLGIASGVNGLVWMFGVGMAMPALHFIAQIFSFLGKEQGYSNLTNTDATKKATASSTMGAADMLWIQNLLTMSGLGLMAMHHYAGWTANQWIGMAPEDQDAAIVDLEE